MHKNAMFTFNKIVGYCLSPFTMGVVALVIGLCWRRVRWFVMLAALWLYVWSIGCTGRFLGLSLEREWEVARAEDMPSADVIVLLGGGVTYPRNPDYPYSDLQAGADRAWYAAKLWKAGKAPVIITSNRGAEKCDNELLMDLGVPEDKIIIENQATTTEENAKFIADVHRVRPYTQNRPKVLLVTSAYHMRRSVLTFGKYAPNLEIIPAPCDFEATAGIRPLEFRDFLPDTAMMARNYVYFKEYLGYLGYRWLRR